MNVCACRGERYWLLLVVVMVGSHLVWVLGTELSFSARAVCTPNDASPKNDGFIGQQAVRKAKPGSNLMGACGVFKH